MRNVAAQAAGAGGQSVVFVTELQGIRERVE